MDWKPQRGGGAQLDKLLSFKTGPIANKLLVTADYYEVSQRTLTEVPTVNGSQATDYYALCNSALRLRRGRPYYVRADDLVARARAMVGTPSL